jgi:hypothetical protein
VKVLFLTLKILDLFQSTLNLQRRMEELDSVFAVSYMATLTDSALLSTDALNAEKIMILKHA